MIGNNEIIFLIPATIIADRKQFSPSINLIFEYHVETIKGVKNKLFIKRVNKDEKSCYPYRQPVVKRFEVDRNTIVIVRNKFLNFLLNQKLFNQIIINDNIDNKQKKNTQ